MGYAEEVSLTGNPMLADMCAKCWDVLTDHERAVVSVSGGSDSDVMMDLVERTKRGAGCKVTYVWFDTGFEWEATKEHLGYLEWRYRVPILRYRAEKTIPQCSRQFGQPFVSKFVSKKIEELQSAGFRWEDEPYEVLEKRYPNRKASLKWWTNSWTDTSEPGFFDIGKHRGLKEFMVAHPPWFRISSRCCDWSKKLVAKRAYKELGADLALTGIRMSESAMRRSIGTCFTVGKRGGIDTYRPLYWLSDSDKSDWDETFGIRHSGCYETWGFKRTGCVGCPFGSKYQEELETAERYEPKMVAAARHAFRDAYEYTRMFHEFRAHTKGQARLDI